METTSLITKFQRMGARIKLSENHIANRFWSAERSRIRLDIQSDRRGEYFQIIRGRDVSQIEVLDCQPKLQHLLLLVREKNEKSKYLCGHDERHWFVAAIPEKAPVGTVRQAMEALKPTAVRAIQSQYGLKAKERIQRKNGVFLRQGEWFFLPTPSLVVSPDFVVCNERLSRGNGSKPHTVDYCFRSGGEVVYVCRHRPQGISPVDYRALLINRPSAHHWGWQMMQRNAGVYVRGRVRHVDHKTIWLQDWHRVLMNTESESKAMRHLAFLD